MSEYQLIITDDDYLQPETLSKLCDFLSDLQRNHKNVPVVWTPRYSYLEDGSLLYVPYKSFDESRYVVGTAKSVGKYMVCGHVLSGLIVKSRFIDFCFWGEYEDNAYFPMILLGDLMYRHGAFYYDENLVHHTVMNECHWESWGKNDITIKLKLFVDYINSFDVFAEKHLSPNKALCFYVASFLTLCKMIHYADLFEKIRCNKRVYLQAISELKRGGGFNLKANKKLSLTVSIFISTSVSFLNFVAAKILYFFSRSELFKNKANKAQSKISTTFTRLKLILYWL